MNVKLGKSYIIVLIAAALALLGTMACSHSKPAAKELTVSILPQKQLLEAIVGDKWKVHCLLNSTANPETYDPAMSHLVNLEKSSAYFRIGHIGFEEAISQRVQSTFPDLEMIDTSKGIEFINGTHGEAGDPDPHMWTSVTNARIMARNMLAAMENLDPANAPLYRENHERLQLHLDSVDSAIHAALDTLKQRSFVVMHPSLSYFARDYGLQQIAMGAEHKESSAKNIASVIDSIRQKGATKIVIEPLADRRHTEMAIRETGLTPVEVNLLDYRWDAELMNLAEALARPSAKK